MLFDTAATALDWGLVNAVVPVDKLDAVIGRSHVVERGGRTIDVIPLPHPSGASGWLNLPAHRALLDQALARLGEIVPDLRAPTRRRARAPARRSRSGRGSRPRLRRR